MRIQLYCLIFALSFYVILPLNLIGRTTGTIGGMVRDADTDEPLAGVSVTIEGTPHSTLTDSAGHYFVLDAPVGLHEIRAKLPGFGPSVVRNQRILAGHTHTVDFRLEAVLIEMTEHAVEGEPSTFLLEGKTASTYRIPSEEIQALPADNYRDIVILQPGIFQVDDVNDQKYAISIRGGGPTEDALYVDGIDVTLQETGWNILDVPKLGMEGMEVITGGWGPEYGDARSGIINIATREGSKNYSGQFRMETDEFMPSGSNYGYNRALISIGGPIPASEDLTFFFSGEVTGLGDRHARADGFLGRNDDIAWLADFYSNDQDVRGFLGRNLNIAELLATAKQNNPTMPVLNIEDYRTDGGAHPGRLVGNEGDETRIQTKFAWQASRNVRFTGSILANRDQGLVFDKGTIFWNTVGNGIAKSSDLLGIFGYQHSLGKSATRSHSLQLRTSFQKSTLVQGPRFNLDNNDVESFGKDLGFDDLTDILNYRMGSIPVFLEDLRGGQIQSLEEVLESYQYDFELRTGRAGRNPFGIPATGFYDEDVGFYNLLGTLEEDRTTVRIDYDAQIDRAHRLRTGTDLRFWKVDYYSNELTSSTFLNFYSTEPGMKSFYIEDEMQLRDFVIDLGLRVDSFNAGVEYPSVLGDRDSESKRSSRKTGVAPRISVSHPISERIQARGGFATNYQVPQFRHLYSSLNVDINEQQNTNIIFGNPDLDLQKTNTMEFGVTALLSDDWLIDAVGYHKDYGSSVMLRYIQQTRDTPYMKILTNTDGGTIDGIDITMRKRLGDYVSTEIVYSLISYGGAALDPWDYVRNEGFFVGGDPPPLPASESTSQKKHIFNSQFTVKLPGDFKEGTRFGNVLRNTGYYFTLQTHSGSPFTRQDTNFDFIEQPYASSTPWDCLANLRIAKDFNWGDLDYAVFADIRNLFGNDNLSDYTAEVSSSADIMNGVYLTTGSPYTDGQTVRRAIDDLGLADPGLYAGPRITDIDGDGDADDDDLAEITHRLDFNGDGTVSVDEELAMRILARGANDADPRNFGIPRLVRLGVEVRF